MIIIKTTVSSLQRRVYAINTTHVVTNKPNEVYTVSQKKEATLIFDITSLSVEIEFLKQFLKHFVRE